MQSLNLWEPLREGMTLREAVNRMFEDSYIRPEFFAPKSMPIDVLENGDAILIQASLPGCTKENVELTFQKDTLTIKATITNGTENGKAPEGHRYLLRERFNGQLTRTVTLSVPVDVEKANATYKDGVLHLTLPKSESVKPRTINVN